MRFVNIRNDELLIVIKRGGGSSGAPRLGYGAPALEIVDDEYELVVVIAVLHDDVHTGVGHLPRELAELPRLPLS